MVLNFVEGLCLSEAGLVSDCVRPTRELACRTGVHLLQQVCRPPRAHIAALSCNVVLRQLQTCTPPHTAMVPQLDHQYHHLACPG